MSGDWEFVGGIPVYMKLYHKNSNIQNKTKQKKVNCDKFTKVKEELAGKKSPNNLFKNGPDYLAKVICSLKVFSTESIIYLL